MCCLGLWQNITDFIPCNILANIQQKGNQHAPEFLNSTHRMDRWRKVDISSLVWTKLVSLLNFILLGYESGNTTAFLTGTRVAEPISNQKGWWHYFLKLKVLEYNLYIYTLKGIVSLLAMQFIISWLFIIISRWQKWKVPLGIAAQCAWLGWTNDFLVNVKSEPITNVLFDSGYALFMKLVRLVQIRLVYPGLIVLTIPQDYMWGWERITLTPISIGALELPA